MKTIVSTLIEAKGWTTKESCFDSRLGQETFPFSKISRHSPVSTKSGNYGVPVKRQTGREAGRLPDLGPGLRMSRCLPLLHVRLRDVDMDKFTVTDFPTWGTVTFRKVHNKSKFDKYKFCVWIYMNVCVCVFNYTCTYKGVQMKSRLLQHTGTWSVAAWRPRRLLSPSSILPPPSSRSFSSARMKNSTRVSKMQVFGFFIVLKIA